MIELRFETALTAGADEVFSLLADLRGYDRWLPRSAAFHGTSKISDGPIAAGTTYVEPGPLGTRYGVVTTFERPARLNFEQPMKLKPAWLGTIGIKISQTLTPTPEGVHFFRVVELSPKGAAAVATPLIAAAFRAENERMLIALKAFVERGGATPASGG